MSEMSCKPFDNDIIDNCFYVENPYAPMHYVKLSEIFNWIKEKAELDEGLTVELKDNKIMFISGNQLINKK